MNGPLSSRNFMEAQRQIEVVADESAQRGTGRWEPITVLIPSYNHADYVAEAIASVAAQDHPGVRLHVVDDGSRDDSVAVIMKALDRITMMECRFDRQSNRGVARTLNSMIERVETDLVAILNSDDWYAPDRLSRILGSARRGSTFFAFSGGDVLNREDAAEAAAFSRYQARLHDAAAAFPTAGFAALACHLPVSSSNFVFSRNLFERSGGFHVESVLSDDRDFLMRCLPHVEPVFVPDALWSYRLHRTNTWRSLQHLKAQALQEDWRRFSAAAEAGGANGIAPFPWFWPRYFRLFARLVNRSIDDAPLATLLPQDWIARSQWGGGSLGLPVPEEVEQEAVESLLRSCRRSAQEAAVSAEDLPAARTRCAEHWASIRNRILAG
jgi:glycosyltransferase involved in cell wall biosynthesis